MNDCECSMCRGTGYEYDFPISKGRFIPDAPTPRPTENDTINKYAEVLANIYDHRTAGDYTFTGVLATFLNEINETH